MSAPGNWVLGAELRDATAAAMRHWLSEHPHRRKPTHCTPEEELRDYAWALHRVPVASVPFVAERVVQRSRGHWPKLSEVRDEVAAFLKRHGQEDVWVRPTKEPEPDAIPRAQLAQAQVMLEALGLDGPEVSRASQSIAIASVSEALVVRLNRGVATGKVTRQQLSDFRDGAFPPLDQLRGIVEDIAERGYSDLSNAGRVLLESMMERVEVPA